MLACALCVGEAQELYLGAMLESIAPVIDILVVNDNSGRRDGPNMRTLAASRFAREGRLQVVHHQFVDFATMRNDAFAALRRLDPEPSWVMWVDADEVHGAELPYIARAVLPAVPSDIARIDGFTYHFVGSFDWISDVARRMTFYRYDRGLRWVNRVHEELVGLRGDSLVLPYVYHHYGNVLPPAMYAAKDLRYYELGNRVSYVPPLPRQATVENVYGLKAGRARRFAGNHPRVVQPTLDALAGHYSAQFGEIESLFCSRQSALDKVRNALAGANERLRIDLRRLQNAAYWRAPSLAQWGLESKTELRVPLLASQNQRRAG